MFRKILFTTSILCFCMIVAMSLSVLTKKNDIQNIPKVLADIDEKASEQKSCGVLPNIKNIKINCPLCTSPEL